MMDFFKLDFRTDQPKALSLSVNRISVRREEPCASCHRFRKHTVTELELNAPARSNWPDIAQITAEFWSSLVLSERVVRDLQVAGILEQSEVLDVSLMDRSGAKHAQTKFYYVHLSRDLQIDLSASSLVTHSCSICEECGAVLTGAFRVARFVPRADSWSGSHLFKLQVPRLDRVVVCTRLIVELAREKRWQGFRFEPIDVELKYSFGWNGIDYLGERWPPDSWYPKKPSEGRSARAWLEMYNSVRDGGDWWDAWKALLDLGQSVVPLVREQFASPDDAQRLRAARLLVALHDKAGAQCDPELLSSAKNLWPYPDNEPPLLE